MHDKKDKRKPRPLTPAEIAAWSAESTTIRPLADRPFNRVRTPRDIAPATSPAPSVMPALPGMRPLEGPSRPSRPMPRPALSEATLDRTWDRKTTRGEVLPDLIIDLHGASLAQAHTRVINGLRKAQQRRARVVLVITGKNRAPDPRPLPGDTYRGVIRHMFDAWLSAPEIAPLIAAVRPAHARHGGDGAAYVILKRSAPSS